MVNVVHRGVLFVCTGNICRSPVAEGVLRMQLSAAGLGNGWRIDSAGLLAESGRPPEPHAVEVAAALGADIHALRSRPFEVADFERFDCIIAMDHGHLDYLMAVRPGHYTGQLALLNDNAGKAVEVPDPYGRAKRAYRRAGQLISVGVEQLVAELASAA